ncbi:MAG: glycosyltransferase [Candidatus Thermoplasmatota archaeon]|nr:glycosyltransferase [Candidatus Thermoplasmatota archaeon]
MILFTIYLILAALTLSSLLYFLVNAIISWKYSKPTEKVDSSPEDITILVPVYNEDPEIFDECMLAAKNQGCSVIVVGDSCDQPYRNIAEKHGAKFIFKETRGGQKKAIERGMQEVSTKFTLLIDSDTVLPDGAAVAMASNFRPEVGGVGPNLVVKNTGQPQAYGAEFIERSREVVYRAMSVHNAVLHLDGACIMYRTDVIKPFILSGEFANLKVAGKHTMLGEDWQLAMHTIQSGYKLVKDYDVRVITHPQKTMKKFFLQNIRWSRSEWIRFGRELKTGNVFKAGKFYSFELIYSYMLPLIALALILIRVYAFFSNLSGPEFLLDIIRGVFLLNKGELSSILYGKISFGMGSDVGSLIFLGTVISNIKKERLRTLGYGALASGILFVTMIYGLLTFWKTTKWLTR